jgi:hypothetical protein
MIHILIVILLMLWVHSADATTYYVGKTGNDSNSCATAQTSSTPKLTITNGMTCLASDDTLIVQAGTYNEAIEVGVPSGSNPGYTILKAADGQTVWVKPLDYTGPTTPAGTPLVLKMSDNLHHIKIERINLDASGFPNDGTTTTDLLWSGDNNHDLIWDGIEMKESRGDAIQMRPASYGNTLRNCYIHDILAGYDGSPSGGIYLRGPSCSLSGNTEICNQGAAIAGNIIENNRFENIVSGTAIGQRGAQINNTIRGNVFVNVDSLIVVGDVSENTKVYNNVMSNSRLCIDFYTDVVNATTEIYNNTFYDSGNGYWGCLGDTPLDGTPGQAVQNNIFYLVTFRPETGTIPSNNFIGDPTFADAAGEDFHLQSTSAAIDTGTTLTDVQNDKDGIPRPVGVAYDPGAYEYHSSCP